MVVFIEKISRSQAKQSNVEFSKSESKAKLGFQNPEAKQSGRQSKVSKVKAKQSSTPDSYFRVSVNNYTGGRINLPYYKNLKN